MITLNGKSICSGVAFGRLSVYHKQDRVQVRKAIPDSGAEILRLNAAIETTRQELTALYEKTLLELGRESAAIFEAHQLILEDPELIHSITIKIEGQKINAEYAVKRTADQLIAIFASMKDELLRARASDIEDVSGRLIQNLSGKEEYYIPGKDHIILVANDLAPGEFMEMDSGYILGMILRQGSLQSHTAILTRNKNIPAVCQIDLEPGQELNRKFAILDANLGTVYIDPDASIRKKYQEEYQ